MALTLDINLSKLISGSKYFTWGHLLFLPKWYVHAFPNSDQIYSNLQKLAWTMDKIKDILNEDILIHSAYRPHQYNLLVNGSLNSYHKAGLACDFSTNHKTPTQVQEILLPYLDYYKIRMEFGTLTWTHIDLGEVITTRHFHP